MGNSASSEPVQLGVRLDKPSYEAGSILRGRVYLQVQTDTMLEYDAIHICIEGMEEVEIVSQRQVDRATPQPSHNSTVEDLSRQEETTRSSASQRSGHNHNHRRHLRRTSSIRRQGRETRAQSRRERYERQRNKRERTHQQSSQSVSASTPNDTNREKSGSSTATTSRADPKPAPSENGSTVAKTLVAAKVAKVPHSLTNEATRQHSKSGDDRVNPLPENAETSVARIKKKPNGARVVGALAVNARKVIQKSMKKSQQDRKNDEPEEYTLRSLPPPEYETVTDRSSSPLIHYDVLLTRLVDLTNGQNGYPFEWTLPQHLPTSMHCAMSGGYCNISYTLTAYLVGNGPTDKQRKYTQATTSFGVTAKPSIIDLPAIQMEPTAIPIVGCCCTNHGVVYLGYEAASHVCPRDTLHVSISGENQSDRAIKHIQVELMEIVKASMDNNSTKRTWTLASNRYLLDQASGWQPVRRRRRAADSSQQEPFLGHQTIVASLVVPENAHDTYRGRMITVRHVLEVTVVTEGGLVTNPSCSFSIQVGRPATSSNTSSTPRALAMVLPEAQAVPIDWCATPAKAIVLPTAPDESLLDELS